MKTLAICAAILAITLTGASQNSYDLIIRGGMVYDGSGRPPVKADVAIKGDKVVKIGNLGWANPQERE